MLIYVHMHLCVHTLHTHQAHTHPCAHTQTHRHLGTFPVHGATEAAPGHLSLDALSPLHSLPSLA